MGSIAVCPDLFWRIEPGIEITDKTDAGWKRAFARVNGIQRDGRSVIANGGSAEALVRALA